MHGVENRKRVELLDAFNEPQELEADVTASIGYPKHFLRIEKISHPETTQRKADAILSRQPYMQTLGKVWQLVMIAHEARFSLSPQFRGSYVRVTETDSWDTKLYEQTEPEKQLEFLPYTKAKIFEDSYQIILNLRNDAGRHPPLERLLTAIHPEWQRILEGELPESTTS